MFVPRLASVLVVCVFGAACQASESKVTALVGARALADSAAAADPLPLAGVEFASREPTGWGAELGLTGASTDTAGALSNQRLKIGELYAGPRYTWSMAGGGIQPYVSGGGALLYNELEGGSSGSEDSFDAGFYAGAGIDWVLGRSFFLGVGARYVWTDATFSSGTVDGDALVPFVRIGAWF